jgi:peptide/nickel transport system substrate-binding protein
VALREDVTFHDGEPLTAEDVAFSFEYIKEWEVGNYIPMLQNFESAEVVDDFTVVLNLTEPTATFISGAMSYVPILPQHIWVNVVEDLGLDHPRDWNEQDMISSGSAIGSGPYMVESIAPAEAVTFVANPDHFHAPQSDRMVSVLYADDDGIYQGMQADDVYFHQADHIGAAAIADAQQDPRFGFLEEPGIGVSWFSFSFIEGSPFLDWHLRHALAYTQDHQTVLDVIMQGHAGRGEGAIAPANEFWHNDSIEWYEFDMDRARQILEDAGYRWDEDGLLHYPENYEPQLHYSDAG